MLSSGSATPPGGMVGPLWVVRRPGAGRPLVLLHGNGESHHVFDALVRRLPGRALVGVDARAHGRSPRGDAPLTIASMADDVADVLHRLDLQEADLLGFSDGGNVTLELLVRHPGTVARALVCGANLDPGGLNRGWLAATLAAQRLLDVAGHLLPSARRRAEVWALMTHDPSIDPARLGEVRAPVLVVVGEHDAIRPEHTALIADSLGDGRLVVLPRAGHAIPRTRPDDLAALVREFFV